MHVHSVNAFIYGQSIPSSVSLMANAEQVMFPTHKVSSFLFFLNATTKSAPMMPANRMKATSDTETAKVVTTVQTVQKVGLYK